MGEPQPGCMAFSSKAPTGQVALRPRSRSGPSRSMRSGFALESRADAAPDRQASVFERSGRRPDSESPVADQCSAYQNARVSGQTWLVRDCKTLLPALEEKSTSEPRQSSRIWEREAIVGGFSLVARKACYVAILPCHHDPLG